MYVFENCSIWSKNTKLLSNINFTIPKNSKRHLFTGASNSGKSIVAAALTGLYNLVPSENQDFFKDFPQASLVSFETALNLLQEERRLDDSDFVEGGIDPGRSVQVYIEQITGLQVDKSNQIIKLFGLTPILDRGLKFLSTGEIRRTLLSSVFIKQNSLIVLDEPFEGLDRATRAVLSDYLNSELKDVLIIIVSSKKDLPINFDSQTCFRFGENDTFCKNVIAPITIKNSTVLSKGVALSPITNKDSAILSKDVNFVPKNKNSFLQPLVQMSNVSVSWSGKNVLENFSWTVYPKQHWLIQGPNGSGKTTILELITGDNPQVYKNDIKIFGTKRGTGETIWDIKAKLGIVSWKLHSEYRYFQDLTILEILISGIYDSIGLYQNYKKSEKSLALEWLSLVHFPYSKNTRFGNLSYGEQRAVLILRASIKNPKILILDEPCQGLDEYQKEINLQLLETIAKQGNATLLHVTHDPSEILPCEKKVLELIPGPNPTYKIFSL